MAHKSGFVNILGKPNAGKSTLMNALLGERLSIITSKAQTTRHRILGILNTEEYQVVFSDTPGILDPKYKLHEKMMHYVEESLEDADVFVLVIDGAEKMSEESTGAFYQKVEERMKQAQAPLIIVLNKIDLLKQEKLETWGKELTARFPQANIIPVSAEKNFNVDVVLKVILEKLPENPPFYEKDAISDRPLRFFASEIIREKILMHYAQEIPYSVQVAITSYKEEEKIDRISAEIYVSRESQKGILIGKAGAALKKTGTEARLELEKFLGKKVFLEMHVKVKKDWRDDERQLNYFGY